MTFVAVVEGDALAEAISARWPEVETASTERSEVRSLIWRFEAEYGPAEAYLHADGICLYMDVWQEYAIWLAIVFRRLTPTHLGLVFCDEAYTFDVRLGAGTTEAELTDLVNAAG
ncbi:hypothetical protein [Streptomyces sp. 4F14]|uniref:hypothetical protein n=1 Tax=Streptomyces sp. 4F14 TaxID=3394380 RepID=UPI003A8675BD